MNTHIVVVIPTYNEKDNIVPLVRQVLKAGKSLHKTTFSVVVVDDYSPDGTGSLVRSLSSRRPQVHLLSGHKVGLGVAYIRGFEYALSKLKADIVVQMDADFSHHPGQIPDLLGPVLENSCDMTLGSRYIEGATIPFDWPWYRVLISKAGNWTARFVAGLSPVNDCTSGFRVFRASLLRRLDLRSVGATGYAFQINILHDILALRAPVSEVPIHFTDRTAGKSKMSLSDITEFILNSVILRFKKNDPGFVKFKKNLPLVWTSFIVAIGTFVAMLVFLNVVSFVSVALAAFLLLSVAVTIQSLITLSGMIYAWEKPERIEKNKSPKTYELPFHSFTAIIPALHEERVIRDTVQAIADIDYPNELKEILVVCRSDDQGTIKAVREVIGKLPNARIQLLLPIAPRNKPDKLNYALEQASGDVVCIFDAEDAPHPNVYQIINTVMLRENVDVIQSGVQLINYRSNWFSTLNVLEYFFWFKSILQSFAGQQVIPLGGNTVFFRRTWLKRINGWDGNCLTEDADLGIRLSCAGAKIRIIYDEEHATHEETPATVMDFIRQRTRWNQGFLQVYKKNDWKALPHWWQRALVGYVLIWPEIQAFLFLYVIASIIMISFVKLPILITMISLLPLYMLLLHLMVLNVGLYEFTKKFNLPYSAWMPFKIIITFIPFQLILGISAVRAVFREASNKNTWDKTPHLNAHRPLVAKASI